MTSPSVEGEDRHLFNPLMIQRSNLFRDGSKFNDKVKSYTNEKMLVCEKKVSKRQEKLVTS